MELQTYPKNSKNKGISKIFVKNANLGLSYVFKEKGCNVLLWLSPERTKYFSPV